MALQRHDLAIPDRGQEGHHPRHLTPRCQRLGGDRLCPQPGLAGDAPDADTTNTIQYNRGVVGAAQDGFGGSDDFRTKTYTIGLQQLPVDVAQEAIP